MYYLLGRFGNRQLYFSRIIQNIVCQLLDFGRHGGREHNCLALFRKVFHNLHDVVIKSHIQHTVCFVQNKIGDTRKVHITEAEVSNQASRSSDYDIGSQSQSSLLLLEQNSVITTVDSYTGNRHEIRESLHLLVYLLRQLAGGSHHNAVNGICRMSAFGQLVQYRQ